MIVAEHLTKQYAGQGVAALQDVSLTINDGAVFGIIGRSGAGKSTLIRCLNLLERPDSGRILVDGHDLTTLNDADLRRQRQRIGMIFQNFNLLDDRTVFENVAIALRMIGIRDSEVVNNRVRYCLDKVGIDQVLADLRARGEVA